MGAVSFKINRLRADRLIDPVGLDHQPALSWVLQSTARNVVQRAFRVQVSEDSFQSLVFDSGEIQGDQSIEYLLPHALKSARAYQWRVWATDGTQEAWSEPARFVTALFDATDWGDGAFITADKDPDSDAATYLSTRFVVKGAVKSAFAYTTAHGLYQLMVDRKRASQDELAPGWTSYHQHLLYQANDITNLLTPGEHEIGAMVGSGWYKGLLGFLANRHNYGERTAFLMKLFITYQDGSVQTVQTDATWQGSDTPITFADIYNGEHYDARLGFASPRPVEVVQANFTVLSAQAGSRVRSMKELPAEKVLKTPAGDTVLDFGQNLSGFVRFHAKGKPGDVVELQLFEVLDKDGNVYIDNLRGARQTIHYTFGDEGEVTFQPHFTFMGYRYAHVKHYPGEMKAKDFTSVALYSQMEETGRFESANKDLNRLWQNILWGLRSNFVDIPTDCPQRNERLGWTGDAQIFCPTACFIKDADVFFTKWLKDLALDSTPEGGVPHVVPDIITPYIGKKHDWLLSQGTHSATAWADCAVILPWNVYLAYGDKRVLRQQYASMKGWVEFMRARAQGCVWSYRLQFGDWVALDAEEGSYFGATPTELVCAAYYAYSTDLLARTAQVLDKQADYEAYRTLHADIVKDFQQRFFDGEGRLTAQTQTAHILALHFGLVADQFEQRTVNGLKALIAGNGGHLSTGFVGTPYICFALSEHGAVQEAYDLLLKEDYPSWLYQVKAGATTIWEHWDGIKPDGSMWSADMNSFNHYAYGAIGEWMFKVVGGLAPIQPGYKLSLIRPRFNRSLSSASAALDTVYGQLSAAWAFEGDQIALEVVVPANTQADIVLDVREVLQADGLDFGKDDASFRARAGSGTYTIRCRV